MVQVLDVIICGSGSAGLAAATYLSRCGVTSYKVLERRDGPMVMGQADGVQCRTVEVYESFGLAEDVLREAYHVLELAFWSPDGNGGICRTGRSADTQPGLSHLPHVILNQARMNDLLIGATRRFGGNEVEYGWNVEEVKVNKDLTNDQNAHCVSVMAVKDGYRETFKAKYVLGCDGAHSVVRKSLGFKMVGDSTDAVWGVMDVFPQTDFPDIRRKCTIRSDFGNLLIIPREGGSLVRFYVELPHGTAAKEVRLSDLQQVVSRIFHPYTVNIAETLWWSAYSIGQRLADHFHDSHRVFLTGDACHTHSPKAGQGMNVSLQDGYNIGWKLAQVLMGQSKPEILHTFILEREKVAANLISFDKYFTKLFSSKASEQGVTPKGFADAFITSGRFMAGLTASYDDSSITCAQNSAQHLAKNLVVGMRFPSTLVVRYCDAKAMQLVKALPADGRWRIVIFAGMVSEASTFSRLNKLADYLSSKDGPAQRLTTTSSDVDSIIEPILVLGGKRVELEQEQIPPYFWPAAGKYRVRDLHKLFIDDESYNCVHGKAYEFYQISPKEGAIAIVRPDQYVSMVIDIDNHKAIGDFFAGFTPLIS